MNETMPTQQRRRHRARYSMRRRRRRRMPAHTHNLFARKHTLAPIEHTHTQAHTQTVQNTTRSVRDPVFCARTKNTLLLPSRAAQRLRILLFWTMLTRVRDGVFVCSACKIRLLVHRDELAQRKRAAAPYRIQTSTHLCTHILYTQFTRRIYSIYIYICVGIRKSERVLVLLFVQASQFQSIRQHNSRRRLLVIIL